MNNPHSWPSTTAQRGTEQRGGLPLVSSATMTATDREALRTLGRALKSAAELVDQAVDSNRIDRGLEACGAAVELGTTAARATTVIGGGR